MERQFYLELVARARFGESWTARRVRHNARSYHDSQNVASFEELQDIGFSAFIPKRPDKHVRKLLTTNIVPERATCADSNVLLGQTSAAQ